MRTRGRAIRRWLLTGSMCLPGAILAYNLDGNRWPQGEATFNVNIPGSAPSGVSWNSAFEDALAQWSEETDFSFLINSTYADPCAGFLASRDGSGFPDGNGDGLNGVDFSDDVCGNKFGDRVLAITLTLAAPGNLGFALIEQSDIVFNNAFTWDIYSGPRRPQVDFRRVALHELGHSLGLDHEDSLPAMMSSFIGDIDMLQADDIEGANALYGGPGDCDIGTVLTNSVIEESLQEGDCAVLELYGGGSDTSFVDTYRLILEQETTLSILMESAAFDAVLLVTDTNLSGIEFDDNSAGQCDALITGTFPAGEYFVLANTYVDPPNCPGTSGQYKISITDNILPVLNKARTASGASSKSIFHGGATSDGGLTYKSSFLSSETLRVSASIQPDPAHVGKAATFYQVAYLSTGQQFARDSSGKFRPFSKLSGIPAFSHTGGLEVVENFDLLKNLQGDALGVSNVSASFFIGYSLEDNPGEIHFNGKPVSFTIK